MEHALIPLPTTTPIPNILIISAFGNQPGIFSATQPRTFGPLPSPLLYRTSPGVPPPVTSNILRGPGTGHPGARVPPLRPLPQRHRDRRLLLPQEGGAHEGFRGLPLPQRLHPSPFSSAATDAWCLRLMAPSLTPLFLKNISHDKIQGLNVCVIIGGKFSLPPGPQ